MSNFTVKCPHCDEYILIEQINCAIFRHAVIKSSGNQLNPHSNKNICDDLIFNNAIYGCGKPFKVIKNPEYKTNDNTSNKNNDDIEEYIAIICEYI